MATSVSEQISELSADLLLRAAGDLAQIAYNAGMLFTSVGSEVLVALINSTSKNKLSEKDEKALSKIKEAVEKDGETPRQITVLDSDRELIEKWLKKQNVLYAAVRSNEQGVAPGFEKSVIVFLEKDHEKANVAVALTQRERGLINELPPQAFLFVHKKKDLAVVNNLDSYELETFRELAKAHGLVYSVILNTPEAEGASSAADTYKVLVSKNDMVKAAAVMQMVSWSMTGEHQAAIKEKIKERVSIKHEIQKLLIAGVDKGSLTVQTKLGQKVTVENAKYIVNENAPHQYLKLTAQGFLHVKFGKEVEFVSNDDAEYGNKIQLALGEFSGAVVFDAVEWEQEGLAKSNARKQAIKQKTSVFPTKFNREKEANDIQKARKHKQRHEQQPETAWLFDRYDTQKAFSEVYEMNYNNDSQPPEETVSVHYGEASKHSEKYTYIDVSNDEKSIDRIISAAREKSGYKEEHELEPEIAR